MKRQNYLNNKDILKEIHKSKTSFCSFASPEYSEYDIILDSVDAINDEVLQEAKIARAKRLSQEMNDSFKSEGLKNKSDILPETIDDTEVVFRVMTYNHIPENPDGKKNPKTVADTKIKVNFPPFQHWVYNADKKLICVGKSHWVGGMENGYFSKDHGKVTNTLALMWLKLVDRYATRGNVRGYSYNDEMRGQAILQLSQIGLQFNEAKSNNPFSYYTAVTTNSFVKVINSEKRAQSTRDDILQMNDMAPSHTRLHNAEWEAALKRNAE